MIDDRTQLLIEQIEYNDHETDDIIEHLNDDEEFLDFKSALARNIEMKYPESEDNGKNFLKERLKEKNIPFNRNTLTNWFEENAPKKADTSRSNLYKIAFALNYNVTETIMLFETVYKDRTFNVRRIEELVYLYCLNNNVSYEESNLLIEECKKLTRNNGHTIHTRKILDNVLQIHSTKELFDLVENNSGNFSTNNESAIRVLESLVDDIRLKEDEVSNGGRKKDGKPRFIEKLSSIMSYDLKDADFEKSIPDGYSCFSDAIIFDVIYERNMRRIENEDEITLTSIRSVPKMITESFPSKYTYSKKKQTYEELRKMIILFASYKYWVTSTKIEPDPSLTFRDYLEDVNGYLTDANMPPMYPGNPFDWLFLYCSSKNDNEEKPLEVFRTIVGDMIFYEE